MLDFSLFEKLKGYSEKLGSYFTSIEDKKELNKDVYDAFKKVIDFIKVQTISKCPICGTSFDDFDTLFSVVTKYFKNYKLNEGEDVESFLKNASFTIKKVALDDPFIKEELGLTNDEFTPSVFINYINLCENTAKSVVNEIFNFIVGNYTLFEKMSRVEEIYKKIDDNKNKFGNSSDFFKFVDRSIKELIYFRSNIRLYMDSDNFSFVLKDSGETLDVYNTLSESELKRLSLIILQGLIKFFNYDVLILDDPIDSYDDYYLNIACDYISEILKSCGNKEWYIFTNNTNCVYNISKEVNCDAVFLDDNPRIVFDDNAPNNTVSYSLPSGKIDILNCNELLLLAKYLDSSCDVKFLKNSDFSNDELPFLAFAITLRNFRDVVIDNYKKIKCSGRYKKEVKRYVEHMFMHYDKFVPSKRSRSIDLLNSHLFKTYLRIINITNTNVTLVSAMTKPTIEVRRDYLNSFMGFISGNSFLNILFFKILTMSELRFRFEQKMIDTLEATYKIKKKVLKEIINENGLGRKITTAILLLFDASALTFVNSGYLIFKKYRTLMNDFDHALTKMFPPYLSASFIDMMNLRKEIENW